MEYLDELITNLMFLVEFTCMTLVFTGLFEKRDGFRKRGIIMLCIAVCLLFVMTAVNVYVPGWGGSTWEYSVLIFILAVFSIVSLIVCYRGKPGNYLFHFISAMLLLVALFAARQICIDTADQYVTGYSDSWLDRVVTLCIMAMLAAFGRFYIVRGFDRSRTLEIENRYIVLYLLISLILFLIGMPGSFVTSYWAKLSLEVGMIVCVVVFLYMQYIIFLRRKNEVLMVKQETERLLAEQMARQSLQLYNELKSNMDIINIKCHDLKHKIGNMSKSQGFDEEEIKEIQSSIDMYNCNIRTGNEYLDVVLSNKSLLATQQKITIMPVADGGKLDFMSPADIYSLFGNAIDNAMEYVATLDEQDRIVRLAVKGVGDFVSICVENPFTGELVLNDGVPETHKDDKQNHGFGIKSMRHIAEKYGGDLQIEAEGGYFRVKVLVERPEQP